MKFLLQENTVRFIDEHKKGYQKSVFTVKIQLYTSTYDQEEQVTLLLDKWP